MNGMRGLVISRVMEYTENGEFLEEGYGVSPDELENMTDVELLDLFQEIVFGG